MKPSPGLVENIDDSRNSGAAEQPAILTDDALMDACPVVSVEDRIGPALVKIDGRRNAKQQRAKTAEAIRMVLHRGEMPARPIVATAKPPSSPAAR